ncbi:MAG: sensor histidine kinase [Phycisphaerales bacterium]
MIAGLVLGGATAALAARFILRRQRERVIDAERRAADAERLAELGTMTGGLAHEIKNPLSTIGLNTQLLAEELADASLEPEVRGRLDRRLGTLQREVDRLRDILTDFLQFAGQVRLHPEPIDLNTLVEELVDFFAPQAENARVRLHFSPSEKPVRATVDGALLKQALLNLMLNATEALQGMPDGVSRDLMLRIERVDRPEPQALIHVTDTGPGMDEETLKQIYRPYYSTKKGGTGLGLPTTRRIVEEHGGRIELHSEPDRGTDFAIRLPLNAHATPAGGR